MMTVRQQMVFSTWMSGRRSNLLLKRSPSLSRISQRSKQSILQTRTQANTSLVLPNTGTFSNFIHRLPADSQLVRNGRSFSSYSPIEWWQNRQIKKQDEKFQTRIIEMAELSAWTLEHMQKDITEATSSWAAKIPGLNNNKEIQQAKQMETILHGLISVVGNDADEDRLHKMNQTEKLKAAIAGETTVEEINRLIHQFQVTSLMHKVVRKRKEEGRSIPTTQEGIQSAIQVDAPALMSKAQRNKMGKEQARKMLRRRR